MSTHEHLEHAEHAEHAAHNPFDRKVAMTMAIIAAGLASVTLLSHRAHNQTILEQAEATTLHTQASDDWNYFQAKNIRTHEYKMMSALIGSLAKETVQEEKAAKAKEYWDTKVKTYEQKDLKDLEGKARTRVDEAKKHETLSHLWHGRSNFFDGGELFIELALVLCSIALLTKMRAFWYTGIGIGAIGLLVALIPYTPFFDMFAKHPEHGDHPPANSAPETPGKSGGGH
jgi:hypothetical protein